MRRLLSSSLISVATFALGVGVTVMWFRQSQSSAVQDPQTTSSAKEASSGRPILAFCEIVNNPNKYSGKVIRLSTTLSGFIHGRVLYDPNCSTVDTITAVFFRPQNQKEIEAVLKEARGFDDWRLPVVIIAEGEFRKVNPSNHSDMIYDTAPLQFEIIRIEKASKAN